MAPDTIFDASYSRDAAGRSLVSFRWAQVGAEVLDPTLAEVISTANTAANGTGTSRLVMTAAAVASLPDGSYTLAVTASSFLGVSMASKATFTKRGPGEVRSRKCVVTHSLTVCWYLCSALHLYA
jgi:hypothetical protein